MPGTRKLGRTTAHRKAMLRGMVTLLLANGQIETTYTRAKELSAIADKMITLGKANTLASRRTAIACITKKEVVLKLFDEIAPLYAEQAGGYTKIYKMGPRRGDGAEMAVIKLVAPKKTEAELAAEAEAAKPAKKTRKSSTTKKTTTTKKATAKKEAPVEEAPAAETPATDAE